MDTVTVKVGNKFYKTTFPYYMIFTKEDVSTSDEQVEKLTRELNIHYRACIGSLIYLFSTRVDLSFAVHKLAKFSENSGKVHFEGLIHLLRYIRPKVFLSLMYLNRCINTSKCTLPGLAENFANLCTAKIKYTLVDNG